jgi:hypothetical protein
MQEKIKSIRTPYTLKDGTVVPSVTTVLSRFKESGGLVHWAWKLGTEGKDYREVRDDAASIGTLAHQMVECHIKGETFPLEDKIPVNILMPAKNAYQQFVEWSDMTRFKVTHSEIKLVSEKYKYGGTIDSSLINIKRSLGDWKSSNDIYAEYLIQLAAYGQLWNENFPNDPIVGGYHLIKFNKTDGGFTHKYWANLDTAWEAFKLMLPLYEIDKTLKKMIK